MLWLLLSWHMPLHPNTLHFMHENKDYFFSLRYDDSLFKRVQEDITMVAVQYVPRNNTFILFHSKFRNILPLMLTTFNSCHIIVFKKTEHIFNPNKLCATSFAVSLLLLVFSYVAATKKKNVALYSSVMKRIFKGALTPKFNG